MRRFATGSAPLGSHALLLVLCSTPFVIGPLLHITPHSASLAGVEAPACPSRWIAPEIGCPGCGLTRSVGFAVQGDLGSSWAVHPGGVLLLLLCFAGIVLHGSALWCGAATRRGLRISRAGRSALAVVLVGGWLARIL